MTFQDGYFYAAWHWLCEHPAFKAQYSAEFWMQDFQKALDIHVAKVDPVTRVINEKDESKNTQIEVWLECGPWEKGGWLGGGLGNFTHDFRLDTGGDTFEEAIIKLAKLVLKYYGDYETDK